MRESSLRAAQQEVTDQPTTNQVAETLRISKPPKMDRPLSLMNEKQLTSYSIDLIISDKKGRYEMFLGPHGDFWPKSLVGLGGLGGLKGPKSE